MNNYAVVNLSMISRLAILENAERTGEAIDHLVAILRYRADSDQSMSTIDNELKIIDKMFALHKMKKGPSFQGIVNNGLKDDRCYISKGILVAIVDVAIGKGIDPDKENLELIVSVTASGDNVHVKVKDNGMTDINELGETIEAKYQEVIEAYGSDLHLDVKPGVGTIVTVEVHH